MRYEDKKRLLFLLIEYSDELTKECNYDCYNCDLGILETYVSGHSCAIDTVMRKLDTELGYRK